MGPDYGPMMRNPVDGIFGVMSNGKRFNLSCRTYPMWLPASAETLILFVGERRDVRRPSPTTLLPTGQDLLASPALKGDQRVVAILSRRSCGAALSGGS